MQGRDCPSEQEGLSAKEVICNGFLLLLFITGHGPSSPGPTFSHLVLYVKCQVLCSFQAPWRCRRVSDLTGSGCPVGLDGLSPYCLEAPLGTQCHHPISALICSFTFRLSE